jgi:hypothetical protein
MEPKTFEGSCHCGAVHYQVSMKPPEKAFACNCSICSRNGWLLAFVGEQDFTLTAGADLLTDYQFGKKHIHHVFCRTCGVRSFSRGTDRDGKINYAINLRCLTGFDASKLPVETFDGASL